MRLAQFCKKQGMTLEQYRAYKISLNAIQKIRKGGKIIMQKREFFKKLKKDLSFKNEMVQVVKNTDCHGNVIKLTIFKPYSNLATFSESTIVVFCDNNLVTVKQYKQGKEILHHVTNYSYNQQNMIQLTSDIIINQLKTERVA